jgi:hypothetical protein
MKNLLFLLCLLATSLPAQPTIEWQKALGGTNSEEAKYIQQTADGGYIMTGTTLSNNGDVSVNHGASDFWVVKLNSFAVIQWQRTYGGTNHDRAYCIQQTSDGGYIVVGQTESNDGDVSGYHGGKDFWVVKLNSTGSIEWQKTLGGSGWDQAWSVRQTSDGGFIVAGHSNSKDGDPSGNHGELDFWVVKLSEIGVIEWQKTLGGSLNDFAYAIHQTPDGGYILTGEVDSANGDVTGFHGNTDYWVVKLSSLGAIEWQRALGSTSLDRANDVCLTTDGGCIVVGLAAANNGDVTGTHGGYDYWAVKLNRSGDIQWQKALGGSGEDFAQSIRQTTDGGYIIAGATQSNDGDVLDNDGGQDIWLVKLTGEGVIQWQKTLGGTQAEWANTIQQTSDGGYIVAGFTWSNNGDVSGVHGYNDFWIVKLSPETVPTTEAPNAQTSHLEIYPNPAQQSIILKTASEESSLNVSIYDLLGRVVLQQNILNGGSVEMTSLANGLYLVVAMTPKGEVFSAKLRKTE